VAARATPSRTNKLNGFNMLSAALAFLLVRIVLA
jgi:hypothetical protein